MAIKLPMFTTAAEKQEISASETHVFGEASLVKISYFSTENVVVSQCWCSLWAHLLLGHFSCLCLMIHGLNGVFLVLVTKVYPCWHLRGHLCDVNTV